jgi:hypothetical protein
MNQTMTKAILSAAWSMLTLWGVLAAGPAQSATLHYTPNMTMQSLANRPDTDMVEFSNGRRVSVAQIRRLDAAAKIIQAPKVNKLPATLKAKPTGKNILVTNGRELAIALKNSNNDTIELPSGRRVTVGLVKFMQPYIEKKLGRKLDEIPKRPELTGPAIPVSRNTTKEEWKAILRKPDTTILQAPNGARITLGELKPYIMKKPRTAPPVSPSKTPTPPAGTLKRQGGVK